MFERLSLSEMGGIGFTIGPMVRFNCYKTPELLQNWSGPAFDPIISGIEIHLNRKPTVSIPSTSAPKPLPVQTTPLVVNSRVTITPRSNKSITINPNKKVEPTVNEPTVDFLSEESIKKFNELNLPPRNKNNTGVPYYGLHDPKAYKNKIEVVKPNLPNNEIKFDQVKIIKLETATEYDSKKIKGAEKSLLLVETEISQSFETSKEIQIEEIQPTVQTPQLTSKEPFNELKNAQKNSLSGTELPQMAKLAIDNKKQVEVDTANLQESTVVPVILNEDFLESHKYKKSDAQIVLKSKKISAIDQYAFRGWRQIEGVYLHDNEITELEHGTFNGLPKLNTLAFEFNSINQIQSGIFNSLTSLQYLKLNCNQIKTIDRSAFNGLYNLKSLDLSNNVIKNIDKATFGDLINLLSLYLNNNLIKQLDSDVFSGLVSLESLDLHGNFIKRFHQSTFKNIPKLKYLDIADNPLDSFDGNAEEFENVEVTI